MKIDNTIPKEYRQFLEKMSSGVFSLQENFEGLRNSVSNLMQNLPDEEKETFALKFALISEKFEMMFNRYNQTVHES